MKQQKLSFHIPQQDKISAQRLRSELVGLIPSSWSYALGGLEDPELTKSAKAGDMFVTGLYISIEEHGEPKLERRRKVVPGLEHANGLFRLVNLHKRIGSIGFTYAGTDVIKLPEILTMCSDLLLQGWVGSVHFAKQTFEHEERKDELYCEIKVDPTKPETAGSVTLGFGWDSRSEEAISPIRNFCRQHFVEQTVPA